MDEPKTLKKIKLKDVYDCGAVVLGRGNYYWQTKQLTETDNGERLTPNISAIDYDRFPEHVYILARTGAGKTTLMKSMIYQSARSGPPVSLVVIDGKDSASFRSDVQEIARAAGKRFIHITANGASGFRHNPLVNSTGSVKEIVERLTDGFLLAESVGGDSAYYKSVEKRLYETLIRAYTKHHGRDMTFDELFWAARKQSAEKIFPELLESEKLTEKDKADLRDIFSAIKEKDLTGAVTNLSAMADLWQDGSGGTIDLYKEFIDSGSVLYFGFKATNPLSEESQLFRMLLREIMQLLHKKNSDPSARDIQTRVFIDEFGVLRAESIEQAVALARESNAGFILAHQSFEQLDPIKRKIIFQNCRTKIFGQLGAEAEEVAKHFGDVWVTKQGRAFNVKEVGFFGEETGLPSYSYGGERVFHLHPDTLRNLRQYELLEMNGREPTLFYSLLWQDLLENPEWIKAENDPMSLLKRIIEKIYVVLFCATPFVLGYCGNYFRPGSPHMEVLTKYFGQISAIYRMFALGGVGLTLISGPASCVVGWFLFGPVIGALLYFDVFENLVWATIITYPFVLLTIYFACILYSNPKNQRAKSGKGGKSFSHSKR